MVRSRSSVRIRSTAPDTNTKKKGYFKMAKKEKRVQIHLQCSECKELNYTTQKNKDQKEKLELKKYCKRCRKHTLHKETKVVSGKKR